MEIVLIFHVISHHVSPPFQSIPLPSFTSESRSFLLHSGLDGQWTNKEEDVTIWTAWMDAALAVWAGEGFKLIWLVSSTKAPTSNQNGLVQTDCRKPGSSKLESPLS